MFQRSPAGYRQSSAAFKPASSRLPFAGSESNLIALRYEQTVAGKAPIPLPPPRNPRRLTRPASADPVQPAIRKTTLIIGSPPSAHSLSDETRHSSSLQSPTRHSFITNEDELWGRDSGLGSASSFSATIPEECEGESICIKSELDDIPSPLPSDFIDSFPSKSVSAPNEHTGPLRKLSSTTPDQSRWSLSDSEYSELPPNSRNRPASTLSTSGGDRRSLSLRIGTSIRKLRRTSTASQTTESNVPTAPSLARKPPPPPLAHFVPASASVLSALAHQRTPEVRPRSDTMSPNGLAIEKPVEAIEPFKPLATDISEGAFLADELESLTFSNRGSVYFGDRRAIGEERGQSEVTTTPTTPASAPRVEKHTTPVKTSPLPSSPPMATMMSLPNIRLVSEETERESQKVRSLYESGDFVDWNDGSGLPPFTAPHDSAIVEEDEVVSSGDGEEGRPAVPSSPVDGSDGHAIRAESAGRLLAPSSPSPRSKASQRAQYERAGGIEDWENVEGPDVDRYGFIIRERPSTSATTDSHSLQTPQATGRRKGRNVLTRQHKPSTLGSPLTLRRPASRQVSSRSLNTQASHLTTASRRSTRSTLRAATNILPQNHDRRMVDLAGDMLSLPPGLGSIEEEIKSAKMVEAHKKREWERSEKWMKMATITKRGKDGQGIVYEFDPRNSKVIERTWKGIPDRWRSAAWYSFLAHSAKLAQSKATEEDLLLEFQRLQAISSSDDMQIDLDVPRTINKHIMFRRPYRGGQRLLFRVLHALSLYFPETGYVQGMAALAASLLCYYDEGRCFIMMVRMWQYRGLEALYQPGFVSLMAALQDLETRWFAGKEVAEKLKELCIDPTAYGTRWYLTLFNLSIPFPAQLRVWDVFMLHGDPALLRPKSASSLSSSTSTVPRGLDIIHATATALIDALKELLLDADFDNAMKALTSWIPIKDEELLMKVVRAEFKANSARTSSVTASLAS